VDVEIADISTRVGSVIRSAPFDELDPRTLYSLLKLRAEVFVVEQQCPYLDPDGRDAEPGALHLWIEEDGAVVATLRLLTEADGRHRIGRVATAPAARGRGLAGALTVEAVTIAGGPVVLDAQSQLVEWYQSLGFEVAGPEFVEDDIAHTPMRRG